MSRLVLLIELSAWVLRSHFSCIGCNIILSIRRRLLIIEPAFLSMLLHILLWQTSIALIAFDGFSVAYVEVRVLERPAA